MQILYGSFVHDLELFDPSVFVISMVEAESISPFQQVLIECAYLAFLDAGYTFHEMKCLNCGFFVGTSASSGERPTNSIKSSLSSVYSATGASASIVSGEISYVLNLQSPNIMYDTACLSSLVALDAAVSALQMRKCDMAFVASANELFDMKLFEAFARAGMLSLTWQCHT